MQSKKCNTCGDIKSITDFNKSKRHKDGFTNRCKVCANKITAEKRALKRSGRLDQYSKIKDCTEKICKSCKTTKLVKDFYFENNTNLSSSSCKECVKKKVNDYRIENNEVIKAKKREYSKKRWEEGLWTPEQLEKRRLQSKDWRSRNIERVKEYNKKYKAENHELSILINANRRARQRQATLNNLSNKDFIHIYKESKETTLTVDHIIPLINNNVCGLHVPWNMQLLTKSENSSKNNKFDGTYGNESWRRDV